MVKKVMIALSLGAVALATSACNTVRGVGQDVESVANAGDRAI